MDRIWRDFAATDEDLEGFVDPNHLRTNHSYSITGGSLYASPSQNPKHNNPLLKTAQWTAFLEQEIPKVSSTPSPSFSLLMCPRRPAEGWHDRKSLAYKPRGCIDFKDTLRRLHVPGIFLQCVQRPRTLFRKLTSSVGGEECQVYMLCVDSILTNYVAMNVTYFPKSQQVYGLFLGFEKIDDVQDMTELLVRNKEFVDNPFVLISAFLELEQQHRFTQVDTMIDALEGKMVEGLAITRRSAEEREKDRKHREGFYRLYTRVSELKMQLTIWNVQLEKLQHVCSLFPQLRPPSVGGFVIGPRDYVKGVQEAFSLQVMRCSNVLEATSLAFQKELADLARKDANVAIGDAKQMKFIALLTMVFLPATAVAGFMDAPVYEWDGKGYFFWIIAGSITGALMLMYFGWTFFFNRDRL